MPAIIWTPNFDTGLESVDSQHKHLITAIEQLAQALAPEAKRSAEEVDASFRSAVAAFTSHFSSEEQLMATLHLDPRAAGPHRENHDQFISQLLNLWRGRESMPSAATGVPEFMSAWLSFHVLGEDMSMARQAAQIKAGLSPEAAFERERGEPLVLEP
jgi:hemerythrin-like metal-binding protein